MASVAPRTRRRSGRESSAARSSPEGAVRSPPASSAVHCAGAGPAPVRAGRRRGSASRDDGAAIRSGAPAAETATGDGAGPVFCCPVLSGNAATDPMGPVSTGCSGSSGLVVSRSEAGIQTVAVTPPPGVRLSVTRTPHRRARLPTAKRPSTLVGTRSSRSRRTSRAFSSARRSALMPRPWSMTSISAPPSSVTSVPGRTTTSTGAWEGENATAFSSSSASIRVRSPTMSGATVTSSVSGRRDTRWYPSIWPSDALMTFARGVGRASTPVSRIPASSIRLSALRWRRTAM